MGEQADTRQERPLPHEALDTPEMRAKILRAQELAGSETSSPGKSADELLDLASAERLDTRT